MEAGPIAGMGVRRLPTLLGAHPALILATAALALHLWASAGYDYFGDELYFIVCGQHPDWGYVDQPPLAPLLAGAERWLFGDNLIGLRLIPTLAAAALTGLSAEAARRLGGRLFARWLTGLAVLLAPGFLGVAQTFSTDSLQPLAWLAASLVLMEAIKRPRPALWYWLGAIVGVAFLDKYAIVFFLAAAALGLVLTPERRVLARPGPWIAAGLALLIALPNLIWQQVHGWPFLLGMYGFWRSAASFRVRIAMNLKGLAYEETMIDLDAGEQHAPAFTAINPAASVPALFVDDGPPLIQSLAILEYLDEVFPDPPLLPPDARGRQRARSLALIFAADHHPLIVPRVRRYLADELGIDERRADRLGRTTGSARGWCRWRPGWRAIRRPAASVMATARRSPISA